jgi:predicted ester cyclase
MIGGDAVGRALDAFEEWRRRQAAGDLQTIGEVLDLENYTETCLGLTGWTTGFDIALRNFARNMVEPWSDRASKVEQVIESEDAVVILQRNEATHVGEFLGIPATGRRIAWHAVTVAWVRDGRVVGQWAQPDLWGMHQQLTEAARSNGHPRSAGDRDERTAETLAKLNVFERAAGRAP